MISKAGLNPDTVEYDEAVYVINRYCVEHYDEQKFQAALAGAKIK